MSNNKRASPDAQTVEWKDTKIDDLTRKDLEKLFKSRHMEFKGLNKDEMVDKIKKDGDVIIDNPESLTNVELIAELRLRNLNDEASKKETLLARYRGEDEEPPRKKQRVGKKPRGKRASCYVTLYTPPTKEEKSQENENENDKDEDENTRVLGVFKSEKSAFENGMDQLLEDIKTKTDKEYKKIVNDLKKVDDHDFQEKHTLISDKCVTLFGEGGEPYIKVSHHEVDP